jgi:hypothetical protein
MRWTLSCTAALAFVLLPASANSQQAAGHVIWLSGEVASINPDKVVRPLGKGDTVREGDVISTGPDSHAQILMSDKGLIALRPDSTLRLTTYTYQGRNDGSERTVVDLIKGGIRSITGAIGSANKKNQVIRSGNILVGIRGTDHETFLQPDAGVYDRVTMGGTYVQSGRSRVEVNPGQIAFASMAAAPALLHRTPDFMHLTKVAVPAGAPFNEGVIAHGKRTLPEEAALPVLPAQAWGENAHNTGWRKGGRCGGPCNTEVLRGRWTGKGKRYTH